jgi:GNAT superfamily N-acetyltransferase
VSDAPIEVVKLEASRIDEAADVLARAFFDYPAWTWMAPDEAQRHELMPWYMRMSMRFGLLNGETYTTAPTTLGVAAWEPPGSHDTGESDPEAEAMWDALPGRMGAQGHARFQAMIEVQRPIREQISGGNPVWYLAWLGVDPAAQRGGVGAALLAHMFARADASSVPCLLETEKQANVPYYERHGFAVVASGTLPLDGPGFWTMLRRPGGAGDRPVAPA